MLSSLNAVAETGMAATCINPTGTAIATPGPAMVIIFICGGFMGPGKYGGQKYNEPSKSGRKLLFEIFGTALISPGVPDVIFAVVKATGEVRV